MQKINNPNLMYSKTRNVSHAQRQIPARYVSHVKPQLNVNNIPVSALSVPDYTPVSTLPIPQVANDSIDILFNTASRFPYSICICATVFDCSIPPSTVLPRLRAVQQLFNKSFLVIVGNNHEYSSINNTIYIHMEDHKEEHARNAYLSLVKTNVQLFDLMCVVDVDAALKRTIPESSYSCLEDDKYSTWDAVFANQSYKYYDVASLRYSECLTDMSELSEEDKKRKVRKLRCHIPCDEQPIQVVSAFGGFAIYKSTFLEGLTYKSDGHVSFNIQFNEKTTRMFIQPSLLLETPEEHAHLYV